jgi:HlyD family secretion protein
MKNIKVFNMIRVSFLLSLLFLAGCRSKEFSEVQTTRVRTGTFTEELTEAGTLRAVNSIAINAPVISFRYGGLKITSLVADGTEVQKGDTLIVFDLSELMKAILDAEQKLVVANAELEKMVATQESDIADLESDLEIARIAREISKINFEQSVFESDITKKEIALKLENADIALERAKEQIENRKKINQEELFQKHISIKQLQAILDEANNSVNNLLVVSPANGIAILERNWMTNQKWQIGEQPYSGLKLIELPDLSLMMAEVNINEVDVSKILPGQEVTIVTDAYTDIIYHGKVTAIANLAQNKDSKSRIKIFPVQISISGASENLLPGLTVSCKIKIKEIPDAIFIPLESLFKDQGNEYVYVKTGSGFRRQDVKTGTSNNDFSIVLEGLIGDEELAMSDPFIKTDER